MHISLWEIILCLEIYVFAFKYRKVLQKRFSTHLELALQLWAESWKDFVLGFSLLTTKGALGKCTILSGVIYKRCQTQREYNEWKVLDDPLIRFWITLKNLSKYVTWYVFSMW